MPNKQPHPLFTLQHPAIFFLVLLLLLTACRERTESVPSVLIRVDGRTVTLEQFHQEFAKAQPPDQTITPEEKADLERSFLVQIIDRELTLAEAERLGVKVFPQEVEAALADYRKDYPGDAFEAMLKEKEITLEQWRRELEEGLLIEKVVREAVYSRIAVSDEEIAAYYEERRDEFDRPAQVRARQIVTSSREEGEAVLALLRQGQPFAEIARSHSLSPDAEEGGDLGFFARGQMPPEFDTVVFTLTPGRLSDLVQSEYGFHIFLVEERREAVRLGLDQAREEIRQRLAAEREERGYQDWLQNLRGRASIEVNWSLL